MSDPSDSPGRSGAPASGEPAGTVEPAAEGSASLMRSSLVMAVGTIASRVTGFVRSLFLVWALGSALFADSFTIANAIPTSIYILIAGGALNAVFVPQLVRAMKEDQDGGEAYGNRLLTLVALGLGAAAVVAVIAAPWLMRIWVSDELLAPENRPYFDLAVSFARYCLPQIFFMGLFVIVGQILNARGSFGPMMWAPIANNVVSIAVFSAYIVVSDARTPAEIGDAEIALLGLGSTLGIAVQSLVLLPVLHRAGFRLRPRFDFRGVGLRKAGRLAAWTLLLVLVNQLWFLTVSRLTSGVSAQAREVFGAAEGYGTTPYLQAFLISQLPHAVITVSLVAALLPRMSRLAADGETARVRSELSYGLRVIAVAILPASAAFVALGPVLTVGLYGIGGQLPRSSAEFIGYVLVGFGPGLLGFCSHYAVLRGFYAYEDTRTPLFIQMAVVGTGIACALTAYLVLPLAWKTVGIAAAYGIGYWVGFGLSSGILRRRLGGLAGGLILRTYLRAGVAVVVAGAAGYGVARGLEAVLGQDALPSLLAAIVGGVVLLGVYLAAARVLRVSELTDVLRLIRSRSARGNGGTA